MQVMELFTYARMRRDEDNSRPVYQEMTDRAMAIYYQSAEATAFLMPEIARIEEKVRSVFPGEREDLLFIPVSVTAKVILSEFVSRSPRKCCSTLTPPPSWPNSEKSSETQ